jgi:hypothetical protein
MQKPFLNIPTKSSSAAEWIAWYKLLPSYLSKSEKQYYFLGFWRKNGSADANTSELRHYFKEEGIVLQSGGIGGDLADTANSFLDTIGGVFKLGATASILMTSGMVVFAGLIIWRLAKPESVGTVIKYAK